MGFVFAVLGAGFAWILVSLESSSRKTARTLEEISHLLDRQADSLDDLISLQEGQTRGSDPPPPPLTEDWFEEEFYE